MRRIGFSTGALARGDFRGALRMLADKDANAVELSALRQEELVPLIEAVESVDLSKFKYVSFHAPSSMEPAFEQTALKLLEGIALRRWPIIVHPNVMFMRAEWERLGDCLCIENMDKRKPVGQTADDLTRIFAGLPDASFCFDIGHARQVDPTMSEAYSILLRFGSRIRQIHVSEVNSQSHHDCLSAESIFAFQKISHLLPLDAPVILESRVEESAINHEIHNALEALSVRSLLASAGD